MSAWIWVQNSADLFDHDKIWNSRNLILAKMSVIRNLRNIVPAKLKCFTVNDCDRDSAEQNCYSISHLLGLVTTQWLDSDGVVTVDNCWQHGDYTIDRLCSHRASNSKPRWLHRHCPVTLPSDWRNRSFAV